MGTHGARRLRPSCVPVAEATKATKFLLPLALLISGCFCFRQLTFQHARAASSSCFAGLEFAARSSQLLPGPLPEERTRVIVHGRFSNPNHNTINPHLPWGNERAIRITPEDRLPLNFGKRFHHEDEEALLKQLQSSDVEERREAVKGYMKLLEKMWKDNHGTGLEYSSTYKFRKPHIVGEASFDALYGRLTNERDWRVRWDAALCFRQCHINDMFVTDTYMARLNQEMIKCRIAANANPSFEVNKTMDLLEAAGRIGPAFQPYVSSIGLLMNHTDWRVRYSAVAAMIQMGPQKLRWRDTLYNMRRDDHEEVRKIANFAWQGKDPYAGWRAAQRPRFMWRIYVSKGVYQDPGRSHKKKLRFDRKGNKLPFQKKR